MILNIPIMQKKERKIMEIKWKLLVQIYNLLVK